MIGNGSLRVELGLCHSRVLVVDLVLSHLDLVLNGRMLLSGQIHHRLHMPVGRMVRGLAHLRHRDPVWRRRWHKVERSGPGLLSALLSLDVATGLEHWNVLFLLSLIVLKSLLFSLSFLLRLVLEHELMLIL